MAVEARAPRGTAPRQAPPRRARRWGWAGLYLLIAITVVALEHLWRGESYWNFSEGVYLATARAVSDGAALYTEVAAAQPPPLFWLGAGLLAISDSLLFVRGALAATTVAAGALVAVIVGRLTGRPAVAVAAGVAALATPWTLREHATLTPDPLAAMPLLAAALLAARPGRGSAAFAGVLAALAASLKLAFVVPAAAIFLAARRRWAYLGAALAAGGALAAASFAVWGSAVWDNLIAAQGETGLQLESLPGLVVQSLWNLGPLILLAALAWLGRRRARDPELLRVAAALVAGSLALGITFLKDGTYLNTLVLLEPILLALAVPGLVWFLEDRSLALGRPRAGAVAVALACAVLVAQSAILLVRPESPVGFGNPFLSRAPGHELSREQVRDATEVAQACPSPAAYSGSPFIAFVAGREVPGVQPDRFIVGQADVHEGFRDRIQSDRPLCPYASPGGSPEGGNASGPFKGMPR